MRREFHGVKVLLDKGSPASFFREHRAKELFFVQVTINCFYEFHGADPTQSVFPVIIHRSSVLQAGLEGFFIGVV